MMMVMMIISITIMINENDDGNDDNNNDNDSIINNNDKKNKNESNNFSCISFGCLRSRNHFFGMPSDVSACVIIYLGFVRMYKHACSPPRWRTGVRAYQPTRAQAYRRTGVPAHSRIGEPAYWHTGALAHTRTGVRRTVGDFARGGRLAQCKLHLGFLHSDMKTHRSVIYVFNSHVACPSWFCAPGARRTPSHAACGRDNDGVRRPEIEKRHSKYGPWEPRNDLTWCEKRGRRRAIGGRTPRGRERMRRLGRGLAKRRSQRPRRLR